ncbi:MAG: TolC family protein [Bacteroidaceae bacterium]|nr:TolC family protein [Bacteroidaceae bacterium]
MKHTALYILIAASLTLAGCKSAKETYQRLYSDYEEAPAPTFTDSLFRDTANLGEGYLPLTDTVSFGNTPWRDIFNDPYVMPLIERALEANTNILLADETIYQAEQGLKVSKLAYLPSVAFNPQGTIASFDFAKATQTYNIPVGVSWQLDAFGNLRNAKKQAEMSLLQTRVAKQAVRTNIISSVANLYYTLLMLDAQLSTTRQTIDIWKKNVEVMGYMMNAGMANGAAVSQYKANLLNLQAGVPQLEASIAQAENALCYILHEAPHPIARAKTFYTAGLPELFSTGIPLQSLQNRPDVRIAELQMAYAFYGRNKAEAAFYPSITLNGSLGWTNSAGAGITNPAKVLASLVGQLTQPIFARGQLNANLRISESEQRRAQLNFEDALLQAGQEVSNYLKDYQTAIDQASWYEQQVRQLETARDQTAALFTHGNSTTYLEKLTAEQSLLSAQLSLINARHARVQALINLYCALGGGREDQH